MISTDFRSTFATLSDSIASLQGLSNSTFDTTPHIGKSGVFCPIPDCTKCIPLTGIVSGLRNGCATIADSYKACVHDTQLPFIHCIQEMSAQTPNLTDLVSIYETVAAQYRQVVRQRLHTPEYKFRSDVVACVCLAEIGIWHSYRRRELESFIAEWASGMQRQFQLGSALFSPGATDLSGQIGSNMSASKRNGTLNRNNSSKQTPFTFETRNGIVTPLMEHDARSLSSEDWDDADPSLSQDLNGTNEDHEGRGEHPIEK
jgi:hypothetical protein